MWQFIVNEELIFLELDISLNFWINDSILDSQWIAFDIILGNVGDTIMTKSTHIDSPTLHN